jgi:D-alanyl-D-alanine carboxypeptidase (penicillin-binding protein 5/6)
VVLFVTKRKLSLFWNKSGTCTRAYRSFTAVFLFLACLAVNTACLTVSAAQTPQAPEGSADAAVLMEADTGTVLYEKNADKQRLIASTTKIMTALVTLENCGTDEKVVIGSEFPAVGGSSIYLKPGDTLTVMDLLYGLLLNSGNDAAVALALHVSGSVERFSDLMNGRAQALGCANSHFTNPHGLDDKDHYSSARDLALISREAMKNKTFRDIVSTKRMNATGRSFRNHNKLLWTCPGALGIKTGYTESAGRSLVSCVEREGMRLICVTLSAPNDWSDHTALYDWAFGAFRYVRIMKSEERFGSVHVVSGVKSDIGVHPAEEYSAVLLKSDDVKVTWEVPRFVYAPVTAGRAGTVTVLKNGKAVMEIPLLFDEAVALDPSVPLTLWEQLKRALISEMQTFVGEYTL